MVSRAIIGRVGASIRIAATALRWLLQLPKRRRGTPMVSGALHLQRWRDSAFVSLNWPFIVGLPRASQVPVVATRGPRSAPVWLAPCHSHAEAATRVAPLPEQWWDRLVDSTVDALDSRRNVPSHDPITTGTDGAVPTPYHARRIPPALSSHDTADSSRNPSLGGGARWSVGSEPAPIRTTPVGPPVRERRPRPCGLGGPG